MPTRRVAGTDRARPADSPATGSESVAPLARDRIVIWSVLMALLALAWGYLLLLDRAMTEGAIDGLGAVMMHSMSEPWATADLAFTFAMWTIMMIGMMAGPAAPMLLLFAAMQAKCGRDRRALAVLAFGLGYATVWIGFSALATLAQWGLHEAAMLSPMMLTDDARVSALILLLAGIYQLTPQKRACLAHCRSPLAFVMTRWRDGHLGALRMGVDHGLFCLGCCWALMALLFVVGVMNLLWVAALTLLVLLEKAGPAPAFVSKATGVALIAAAVVRFAG